uniref:Uncharacterized protein n=1 Tax=Kalanchoe fedtschenkoi TaxID=63787 RepID=A0A7N0REC1_KALFE
MLPGEPKDKPANDEAQMPPLSPPPALQSLSLPKPGVEEYLGNRKASASSPSKLLLKLWKKMSRKMSKRVAKRMALLGMNDNVNRHIDLSISADSARDDDVGARVDLVDLFEDFQFGSPVGSTPPCNKAMSSSSCSLSHCSSTSSAMQDSDSGNAAGADENVNSRMPFARRSSWSLSRMVVVCTSGAKRV